MKVRFQGNSVRFRLKQSEVAALAEGRAIEDHCELPVTPLRFRIQPGVPTFTDVPGFLLLTAEEPVLRAWALSDEVGITIPYGNLHVLVEKDFHCLDASDPAENEDSFPHPGLTCQ